MQPRPIIHEKFPDLQWLKKQIATRFEGVNNSKGWSNVIINAHASVAERPDIRGPLSLFLNVSGNSWCSVDRHRARVDSDFYFLSNQGEHYTLEIESKTPVETFNIHFGENFMEEIFSSLVTPADRLLNNRFEKKDGIAFFSKLYRRDEHFNALVSHLYREHRAGNRSTLFVEEQLARLLGCLLQTHREVLKDVAKLPAVKQTTKAELYKRLSFSIDYIHSHYTENIDLEALAATACLSKYHFLRLFKLAFGLSPYQYLQQVRIEQAKSLLRFSEAPIYEIAVGLGFENASSFSRLFYQRVNTYPTQFRVGAK